MNTKRSLNLLPGLVVGLGAGSMGADAAVQDVATVDAKTNLETRIASMREYFQDTEQVKITGNRTTLAWYNWDNGFDNWNNGTGR